MKRIISLLAAFAVVLVMSVPAFAAPEVAGTAGEYENSDPAGVDGGSVIEFTQSNYVVDNADLFTDDEETALFEKITEIRNEHEFDIVCLTTTSTDGKEDADYTDDFFDYNGYGYGVDRNGAIMMLCIASEDDRSVYISGRGSVGTDVFSSAVLDFDEGPVFKELKPLLSAGDYYDAEMKFLETADERLTGRNSAASTGEYAYTSDPAGVEDGSVIEFTQSNYVVDNADAFTDSEEAALFEKITAIRTKYKFDVVILTTLSMNGKKAVDYTDDFFDYNGYGYGVDRDGVILMLCLAGGEGNRDVHISGRGSVGRNVFNSKYVLNFDNGPIFKELKPLLSAGKYYDAEMKFLEMADERLGWYADDIANGGTGKVPYPASVILKRELIAVAVAMVIAFFVVSMFKKTMKTNRIRTSAENYEKPGSMRVTASNEYFVRKQVSRTAIPKNESSDSSGDHTSSSGASHSGGGGKF